MSAPNVNFAVIPEPVAPPQTGRRRNTGLIIGIIVAVLASAGILVGALVGVSHIRADRAAAALRNEDIREQMLPIPTGATVWNLDYGVDGILSADDAGRFMGHRPGSTYGAWLADCHFQTGGIEAWRTPSGDEVIERLFRFASPSFAQQFLEQSRGSEIAGVRGTDSYDLNDRHAISGVTLGMTLMYSTPDDEGYKNMLAMGTKDNSVFIFIVYLRSAIDPSLATSLVLQQVDQL